MKLIDSFEYKKNESCEYRALNCRGFSFDFFSNMIGFPMNLKKNINLRFAITSSKRLFYPSRIKSYLKNKSTYYNFENYPSIAFSLGKSINRKWFLLILQSDLVPYSPSIIRDHFRGWRKILLFHIIKLAHTKKVEAVYLNTPSNITKYYSNAIEENSNLFTVLKNVYERSATEFNMHLIKLNKPIDIQLYPFDDTIYSDSFYELKNTESVFFKKTKVL